MTTQGTLSNVTARKRKYVLFGIVLTWSMNEFRSAVGMPLTAVIKFVGERPYWYAGEPRLYITLPVSVWTGKVGTRLT